MRPVWTPKLALAGRVALSSQSSHIGNRSELPENQTIVEVGSVQLHNEREECSRRHHAGVPRACLPRSDVDY
ncbi:hypothetical protein BDZ89DRAFT_1076335 [Hymenopellis radicata]|nr:hypothetical protein BDZ89DRAFT_1076335 [Hymenopellis radicata]